MSEATFNSVLSTTISLEEFCAGPLKLLPNFIRYGIDKHLSIHQCIELLFTVTGDKTTKVNPLDQNCPEMRELYSKLALKIKANNVHIDSLFAVVTD